RRGLPALQPLPPGLWARGGDTGCAFSMRAARLLLLRRSDERGAVPAVLRRLRLSRAAREIWPWLPCRRLRGLHALAGADALCSGGIRACERLAASWEKAGLSPPLSLGAAHPRRFRRLLLYKLPRRWRPFSVHALPTRALGPGFRTLLQHRGLSA